jgi:hypothetical protein
MSDFLVERGEWVGTLYAEIAVSVVRLRLGPFPRLGRFVG